MKTKGMQHQLTALRRMAGQDFFALFMEQGTGKTWAFLADAERLYSSGKIDGILVVAPKGVHTNWVLREIPLHMNCSYIARAYNSGMGKKAATYCDEVFTPRERGSPYPLRILTINFDAIRTRGGLEYAKRFLISTKSLFVIDESSRIKNEKTENYKAVDRLRPLAKYRRIGSGLPITNAPEDIFAQMEFLESGLMGTTSFRAFKAEYNVLYSADHPMIKKMVQNNARLAWAQIKMKDEETGRPITKNLDKLSRLLAPHSFRILKKDCMDLPPKVYKNVYFDLTPTQAAAYKLMKNKFRYVLEDKIETVAKLNAIAKLQQITSGFILSPDRKPVYLEEAGLPRLKALLEIIKDIPDYEKVVIWAHHQEEIKQIVAAIKKHCPRTQERPGRTVVEYHGKAGSQKTKDQGVDDFAAGRADTFVGQGQSGGIGLTILSNRVIYYSVSYNLETRKQSEDRSHRKGTIGDKVLYQDLVAEGTIDEDVAIALQQKAKMAEVILDNPLALAS